MRVDPHDIFEALIQAPGEQVLELGKEIEELRNTIEQWDRVSSSRRKEIVRRLDYYVARTREIEPVVEKLQEVIEVQHRMPTGGDPVVASEFMARAQPPFAALLLQRLAAARDAGDAKTAGEIRDVATTYSLSSSLAHVRDTLVNGLRLDAYAHGETRPGYRVAPLRQMVEHLRST